MILPILAIAVSLASCPEVFSNKTDREFEQLIGAVRNVSVQIGKLSRKSGKLHEGRRYRDRTIDYDREGNRTAEIIEANRPTITRTSYRYAADGSRTDSVLVENPDAGDLLGRGRVGDNRATRVTSHVFKYDAQGNRVEESISRIGSGAIDVDRVVNRHTYDSNGNRIATTHYSDGMLLYTWEFKYDEHGHVVRMTKYSRDRYPLETETYTYEFDSIGNWVKRFMFRETKDNGEIELEPREATYRAITYY